MESRKQTEAVEDSPKSPPLDRATTCPFLMRVFIGCGYHNSLSEYKEKFPCDEVQIYTWLDATLLELMTLIQEVKPDFRRMGTLFDFALVFPVHGVKYAYRYRNIGATLSKEHGDADAMTLLQTGFHIGDYMDIAVTVPEVTRPRRLYYNPHFPGHEGRIATLMDDRERSSTRHPLERS